LHGGSGNEIGKIFNFENLNEIIKNTSLDRGEILISIVMPVYNEEKTIKAVLESLPNNETVEILVIDDHSSDKSLKEIESVSELKNLIVLKHHINKGYGSAILTGIRKSKGEIIVTMDSDGQHQSEDIINLVEPIVRKEADITVGSRYVGSYNYKVPVSTRIGEAVIEMFIKVFFNRKVMNNQGGFRAFHRKTLKMFDDMKFEDYAFTTELLLKAALLKFKIKEVPINLYNRDYGSSKIILTKLMLHLLLCIVYYTIQWVNRPYVNKWMIKRLIFIKKLPIYGKPKIIQNVPLVDTKVIPVADFIK